MIKIIIRGAHKELFIKRRDGQSQCDSLESAAYTSRKRPV